MCFFITLVLPSEADLGNLREVVTLYGRLLKPALEANICKLLRPDELAFVTGEDCDCGSGLVSRAVDRKARARGRELDRGPPPDGPEAVSKDRASEVERWRGLLSDLLAEGADQVGLVVHWVTQPARRGPTLTAADLTAETIGGLEENLLYTFVRRPPS